VNRISHRGIQQWPPNREVGHPLHVVAEWATGMRRGEILAVMRSDVDSDGARIRIVRSLEETKAGLGFKQPKTKHGERTNSLPSNAVMALRDMRRR
jgi:integrase